MYYKQVKIKRPSDNFNFQKRKKKESKGQRTKGTILSGLRNQVIAGKDLVASAPLTGVLNGVRIHAPTSAMPVHVHGTQLTGDIANIEDVGITVIKQFACFTISLTLHHREYLAQIGF